MAEADFGGAREAPESKSSRVRLLQDPLEAMPTSWGGPLPLGFFFEEAAQEGMAPSLVI